MAAIERADLRKPPVRTKQIGQRAPVEPLAMQPPLAAWRQQPVGHQHEQHLVPGRALAARRKFGAKEPVKPKLAPEHQRQPAGAKAPRAAEPKLLQLQPDDRAVVDQTLAAILRKQRQRPRPPGTVLERLDRLAPGELLRVVDLAQIQNMTLHHAPAADPAGLHNAEGPVLLAVLPANLGAQKHDGCRLCPQPAPRKSPWSALQPVPQPPALLLQRLARRKSQKPMSNRRSQVRRSWMRGSAPTGARARQSATSRNRDGLHPNRLS